MYATNYTLNVFFNINIGNLHIFVINDCNKKRGIRSWSRFEVLFQDVGLSYAISSTIDMHITISLKFTDFNRPNLELKVLNLRKIKKDRVMKWDPFTCWERNGFVFHGIPFISLV